MSFEISIKINNNNKSKETLENAIKYLERAFLVNMDYKEPMQLKDITYHYAIITPKATGGRPHKLSDKQQQEIQTRFKNGETKTSLMKEFNISRSLINNICKEN